MESLWEFLNSISLTRQNKLWLAEHLVEDVADDTEVAGDEAGIPMPSTRGQAMRLVQDIEAENEMLGELSFDELMKETKANIEEYGH